ncbi:MAG: efflux RND transporter periplasmic adaptor subunit [Elusimicrobiota bacterium]|nr:efflux RND transporter periplasmic adaptor subunit [Elusimicrobiota bacterium]
MKKVCTGLLALFVLISFSACDSKKQATSAAPLVETIKVVKTTVPWDVEYPAQIVGSIDVDVRAQVGGILKKKFFKEGDYVEEGVQLFQIDPSQYETALKKAEGTLAQAQTEVNRTKRDYNRMKKLYKENAVSQKDHDDSLSAYERAKANLQVAQGTVDDANIELTYTKVLAPTSGVTRNDKYDEGNLISTIGDASFLLNIVQIDPLEIRFSVPSSQWHNLLRNYKDGKFSVDGDLTKGIGQGIMQVQVVMPDGNIFPHTGSLKFVDSSEDQNTGTISIKATLPNPEKSRALQPGQFVTIILKGINYENAMIVPQGAVLSTAQGNMVYVIDANGTANLKPVESTNYKDFAIVEGLQDGDVVISSGVLKVKPGSPVKGEMKELDISSIQPKPVANLDKTEDPMQTLSNQITQQATAAAVAATADTATQVQPEATAQAQVAAAE